MTKPNILFIFTDDQRFDTLSALGNPEIDTPYLDRLAARGTTFTHAHIMGGTSAAVCMPSRAMMLTGRTLFSIEEQGQRIPPEHPAMPEWFRQHGYATAHVGKWHQDRASHARCFSTGAKIFGFKRSRGWYEASATAIGTSRCTTSTRAPTTPVTAVTTIPRSSRIRRPSRPARNTDGTASKFSARQPSTSFGSIRTRRRGGKSSPSFCTSRTLRRTIRGSIRPVSGNVTGRRLSPCRPISPFAIRSTTASC